MKAIVTMLCNWQVGIITKVRIYLSNGEMNVPEISKTIPEGYFNMIGCRF